MSTDEERRAARAAKIADRAAARQATLARTAAVVATAELEVRKARDRLLAFDAKPQRRALVAAFREAVERLADARHPNRSREAAKVRPRR